jgi:hypothetical protein
MKIGAPGRSERRFAEPCLRARIDRNWMFALRREVYDGKR